MGLSTTTLHLYGVDRAALAALLPPGYLLRSNAHGCVTPELFETASLHVWRLDPARQE